MRGDHRSKDFDALNKMLKSDIMKDYAKKHNLPLVDIRVETDTMDQMRQLLNTVGFSDIDIDTFKACLIALENHGFQIRKREQ